MAVADVAEFEWKKFWKHLRESDTEITGLSLISEFQGIQILEEEENHRRLMAGAPKDYLKLLRRLNDELAEYRILAHHYKQIVDKKMNIFLFSAVTKKLFLRKRRKNLAQISQELLRIEALVESERRSRSSNPVRGRRLSPTALVTGSDNDVGGNIGLDDMADEIENVLLGKGDDDFIGYGITGVNRSAKVALARKVFNSPRICREFPIRIWVDYSKEGTDELLTELNKRLSEHKYLIVLDDFREEHSWHLNLHETHHDGDQVHDHRLSYGLPKGNGRGGAVIVTSKEEQLVKRMVGEHSFTTHIATIIGYDDLAYEIENVLLERKDDDFIAHGITGMAAVGKTALALKVFYGRRICQEFPTRIWVSLSDVDMRSGDHIQIEIVTYMLKKLEYEVSEELRGSGGIMIHLLSELKMRLSKSKYLIVLDGAWQENPWYLNLHDDEHPDSLSFGLPKGGAVVVTSRQEQLVKRMVGEHSFTTRLDHETALLQDICRKIFENALDVDKIFKINQKEDHEIVKTGISSQDQIEEVLLREPRTICETLVTSTGSSAITQQVLNSPRIRQEFPTRVWVSLSNLKIYYTDDSERIVIREIIPRILQKLDCNTQGKDDKELITMIRELLHKSKYLIVLDNVPLFPYIVYTLMFILIHDYLPRGNKRGAALATIKWNKVIERYLEQGDYVTAKTLPSCLAKIEDDIKYKIQGLPLAAN